LYFKIGREKIHFIIRDGASAMLSSSRMLSVDSIWCFAHVFNLVDYNVILFYITFSKI